MKRINSRTVELTLFEDRINTEFTRLRDTGLSIRDAALQASEWHGPALDRDFVEYLSDGTLTKDERGNVIDAVSTGNSDGPRTYSLGLVLVLALLAGFAAWWLNPARAFAAEPDTHACGSQWVYEHPAGQRADECRAKGWVIRYRDVAGNAALVVTPHRVVSSTDLPMCRYEDGSGPAKGRPCIWWGQAEGNGKGLTYWVSNNLHVHYMWPTNPTTGDWVWVGSEQADALAEGDSPGATTRHWERCVTRLHQQPGEDVVRQVKCPDGFTEQDAM